MTVLKQTNSLPICVLIQNHGLTNELQRLYFFLMNHHFCIAKANTDPGYIAISLQKLVGVRTSKRIGKLAFQADLQLVD